MKSNNLFPIAKEGFRYIIYAVIAYIIFDILDFDTFEFLSFLSIISLICLYRNPEREKPTFGEKSVVSPVDGKVLSISNVDNEDWAYKVEIGTRCRNVSILRVPMDSAVENISIKRGARLAGHIPLAKKLNENAEIIYKNTQNQKIKVSHMLKQSFDEIHINIQESQKLPQGSRYGVMINGITTIYLPQNFRLNITQGSKVRASQTLVGYFS